MVEREDGGHYSHLQRWLDRQDLGHTASNQLAVELGLKCPERAEVDHLTREQLEKVRKDWYAPNNMTLIVVGDLDRLLPAYLERAYGAAGRRSNPTEHPPLPQIQASAAHERNLIHGLVGGGAKLHWLVPEPVLEDQHDETFDLLKDYLDWALYRQLRLAHGLSYGPSAEREVFGGVGFMSLNADLERDDVPEAEQVLDDIEGRAAQGRPRCRDLQPPQTGRHRPPGLGRARQQRVGRLLLERPGRLRGRPFRRPGQGAASGDAGKKRTRPCASCSMQPGYLRIEKPLISYDQLMWVIAGGAGLGRVDAVGLAFASGWRSSSQKARSAARLQQSGDLDCCTSPHRLTGGNLSGIFPTTTVNRRMPNLTLFVQRILELMKRYPGVIALGGFISGVGSFMLVDRQQGLATWITIIMLVSWIWLMLENSLTKLFTRIFKREIPQPLLRYATQMIHQESLFFVLPFFFITTTWNSGQLFFTGLLGVAALISIIDPLYYKWLAPRRWAFLALHTLTLFAALLTALPVILHLTTAQSFKLALGIAVLLSFPSLASIFPIRTVRSALGDPEHHRRHRRRRLGAALVGAAGDPVDDRRGDQHANAGPHARRQPG